MDGSFISGGGRAICANAISACTLSRIRAQDPFFFLVEFDTRRAKKATKIKFRFEGDSILPGIDSEFECKLHDDCAARTRKANFVKKRI